MFMYSQAQSARTERARAAIQAGRFQVTRTNPQQWTVRNGSKPPYVVSLRSIPDPYFGSMWSCTCPDYQQLGPMVHCKHIEGVRLSEAALDLSAHRKEKEKIMKESPPKRDGKSEERVQHILWELEQPLDMSRVKRRQAPGMGSVPYLEGYDVIDRANRIFGFGWSFDIIGDPVIVRWQRKVMVWSQNERRKVPSLDASGSPLTEEAGLVYITGKVTVDLDGQAYSHADLGRCTFNGDTPESLDMALAGSATDCLKRCFRQLGEQFGNLLYDKEIAQSAGLEPGRSGVNHPDLEGRATRSKPALLVERKYGDGTSVNGNASEQAAYDHFMEKTGKVPANKDELRSWITSQRSETVSASIAA